MAVEMLTYADLATRLNVSTEAARALAKRHRLPRSRANNGKALVSVDLTEVEHKALPARSPGGHRPPRSWRGSRRCRPNSMSCGRVRVVTGRTTSASVTGRITCSPSYSWPQPSRCRRRKRRPGWRASLRRCDRAAGGSGCARPDRSWRSPLRMPAAGRRGHCGCTGLITPQSISVAEASSKLSVHR